MKSECNDLKSLDIFDESSKLVYIRLIFIFNDIDHVDFLNLIDENFND